MSRRIFHMCSALAIAAFFLATEAAGDIYETVDDQGRTRYSNQPQTGASRVKIESRAQVVSPNEPQKNRDDRVKRAREQRERVRRWADSEASRAASRKASAERAKESAARAAERRRVSEQAEIDIKKAKRKKRSRRNRRRRH